MFHYSLEIFYCFHDIWHASVNFLLFFFVFSFCFCARCCCVPECLVLAAVTSDCLFFLFIFLSSAVYVMLLHDSKGNVSMQRHAIEFMDSVAVPECWTSTQIFAVELISYTENVFYLPLLSTFLTANSFCSLFELMFWQMLCIIYIQLNGKWWQSVWLQARLLLEAVFGLQ